MHSAMEQTRYLMWSRRKMSARPPPLFASSIPVIGAGSTYHESWEEQAFAEDSSGLLGGCVWPPRSYSCSFCRREFRSAQALGGHMNVHRRDRARLKQSSSPTRENHDQYLDQISNPECHHTNPNPNSYSLPIVQEQQIGLSFPIPRSYAKSLPAVQLLGVPDLKLGMGSLGKRNRDVDEEIVNGNRLSFPCYSEVDEEIVIRNKRRRIELVFPPISKPIEVLKLSSCPDAEELDLELRLGNPPEGQVNKL